MSSKKSSLMLRLMIPINLVVFVMMILLGFEILISTTSKTTEMVNKEIDTLANAISISTEEFLIHPNYKELQLVANKIAEDPSVFEIIFKDIKNQTVATKSDYTENRDSRYKSLVKDILDNDHKKVGTVEIVYNLDRVDAIRKEFIITTGLGILGVQILLFLVVYFIFKKSITSLSLTATKLRELSKETQQSSNSVRSISEEVSSSTNAQASSIQETVATLDEISSQVNTTVESAVNSTKKAEESHSIASEGKNVVSKMIQSMDEISGSNLEIMNEIERGNERIAGIVKIINEISQKTAVINDIVFQTKLLSFNASVEAARAGEHGKGFAVVAEEVGNLAQMSGKASTEIAEILTNSIATVNNVIKETNTNVQTLVAKGNEKVKNGAEIAGQCGKVLDEVVLNAALVKNMMNEVTVASREQAEGVKNIAQAMNQLDESTLKNNKSAVLSFENAKSLANQSGQLQKTVEDLEREIFGGVVEAKKVETVKKVTKTEKIEKKTPDNILPLKKERPAETVKAKKTALPAPAAAPVAASDSVAAKEKNPKTNIVPEYDDPRFEDV